MIKIVSQLDAGNVTVVTLDAPMPKNWNKEVEINGKKYQTEIVYDFPNSLGIVGKGNFAGEDILFI